MSQLPDSITVGDKTRTVSRHLKEVRHSGITAKRIEYALDNWLLRGIRVDRDGSMSWTYLAFVPGVNEMVRVAVSIDDQRIITAFADRTATRHWNRGDRDYFRRGYENLEERDESTLR